MCMDREGQSCVSQDNILSWGHSERSIFNVEFGDAAHNSDVWICLHIGISIEKDELKGHGMIK